MPDCVGLAGPEPVGVGPPVVSEVGPCTQYAYLSHMFSHLLPTVTCQSLRTGTRVEAWLNRSGMLTLTAWVPLVKLGRCDRKHALDTSARVARLHGVKILTSCNHASLCRTHRSGDVRARLKRSLGRWRRRSTCRFGCIDTNANGTRILIGKIGIKCLVASRC